MEWRDQGIVLSARKHGESSAIVTLLTAEHGRHAGLVRGGAGRRARGLYQPGNRLAVVWRARLAEHLGGFSCEMIDASAAVLLDDPLRLAGLSAACAVADRSLPERQPHVPVYQGLNILIDSFDGDDWPSVYLKWEMGLLQEMGFGLDLSRCAATGVTENLTHVSPKTGRAVSAAAAAPYKEKLLALPRFLLQSGISGDADDVVAGLALTGYFLERHVFGRENAMPDARHRLVERLRRAAPGNA